MKSFPVIFLMLFTFESWSSEAGPLFSLTSSKNMTSPRANTNWPILDVIASNFRRKISEQDTILENNLGNVTNSLEIINNAVDKMDRSLSDLVETTQEFYRSFPSLVLNMTELVMNKLDKLLPCDKQLVEPTRTSAQASWNAAEDRVNITCNEGFMTESQASEQTVECLRGRWTAYEPCKRTCDKQLVEPTNAQASWNTAESQVNITCNEGFMTESQASEQTVECLGGSWTYYEPCKRICPEHFVVEGDLCLRFVPKAQNWKNAKDDCEQMGHGATLAMPTTAFEARSIKYFLVNNDASAGYNDLWLGATEDTDDRGSWYWLDESPVVLNDELHWNMGEPNDDNMEEDCLNIDLIRQGGLNDNTCGSELPYVCEVPASE